MSPKSSSAAGILRWDLFLLLLLGLHNALVYGASLRTGYGFTNEQSAFSSSHFAANLPTYLDALTTGGVGLFFLLGSVGIVWMCAGSKSRTRGGLFLGAVASLMLLYSAYYWGAQEEAELTLRYFLATLPLLVLGTLWLVQRIPYRRASLGLGAYRTPGDPGHAGLLRALAAG